ncbi:DNA polymerase delta small subunit Cdc1 [Sporothrix stenoceras]|uniref:DNA polymerase delta small subunit Cdc1 n=1 Tax=Sporothrix stenoceras TaxID=5173 RepID=A0ABR3Z389_9PEZI
MVSLDAAKSLLAAPLCVAQFDSKISRSKIMGFFLLASFIVHTDLSPSSPDEPLPERVQTAYVPLHRFDLQNSRQYQQQFADMYFLRLAKIKPAVDAVASDVFDDVVVGGAKAKKVERVLDVRQGELCWVSGTVYMDMPFKPSILEDVSKDKLLSKPSTVKKYVPEDNDDILAEGRGSVAIMLEDDSGRIRLVGRPLRSVLLVTGCIIAVMGTENEDGELEVIDIMFPDLPPQPERWQLSKPVATNGAAGEGPPAKKAKIEGGGKNGASGDVVMDGTAERKSSGGGKKIAIVSGLNFSGPHGASAVETSLLLEYLLGEALAPGSQEEASHISRLIIAGNSITTPEDPEEKAAKEAATAAAAAAAGSDGGVLQPKKYGYDSASYNPVPSALLDEFLAELLPSMPVTLMPGVNDPANASIPQQPIHPAMFPNARLYTSPKPPSLAAPTDPPGWFDTVTNPWEGEVEGWRVLGVSGQTIDDIHKYVQGNDRLSMMEATCRWRCAAPTAPDTLWTYPYQEDDPFVLDTCPHVYFAGSQPEFGTRLITGPEDQTVRLIAVPAFSETREVVLLDTETLEVTRVKIGRQ